MAAASPLLYFVPEEEGEEEVPHELTTYQEHLATNLNWTRSQLHTLRDASEQLNIGRLQELSAQVEDISDQHLPRPRDIVDLPRYIIGRVVHAWELEKKLGAIYNELVFLWIDYYGAKQKLPVLTAKFSHEDQMPFKREIIKYIASHPVHCEAAACLKDDEAISFLDELQEVIDCGGETSYELRENLIRLLHEVAHASHHIPSVYYLSGEGLKPDTCDEAAAGGEARTYRADLGEQNIAIRVIKYPNDEDQQLICHEILIREILVWGQLKHENILFCEGVLHPGEVSADFPIPCRDIPWIVSKWQRRGDILDHIRDAHCTSLETIDLIIGIAEALNYLHHYCPPVIHGDVKPSNVLVSAEGKALLSDFGRVRFSYKQQRAWSHPYPGGTTDYLAPEIIQARNHIRTTEESDIFAFGMLVYRVCSGSSAFPGEQNEAVMIKVAHGERPDIPDTGLFADSKGGLSDLVKKMWAHGAGCRPKIRAVLDELRAIRSKLQCSV